MDYKVRRNGNARSLAVPREIASLIPDETLFRPELVEDGLLYRRVVVEESGLPAWVRREE